MIVLGFVLRLKIELVIGEFLFLFCFGPSFALRCQIFILRYVMLLYHRVTGLGGCISFNLAPLMLKLGVHPIDIWNRLR